MTQRQVSHQHGELPDCGAGHAARHINDLRCLRAGGGHFIECACARTGKHLEFEAAAAEWQKRFARRRRRGRSELPAQTDALTTVIQFPLNLRRKP